MTVWGRREAGSRAAAQEQAGKDDGWSWREKAGGRATASHLALGLAGELQLPLLRATTQAPSLASSPDGSLLLQASALLSVKDNLGESDCTFLMAEASQIAAASTVTLKCKPDKICLSLLKAEASQLLPEMLCWFSSA